MARLCDDGPVSITRLTARFRVSRQAIKHLHVMEAAGLVHSRRRGRERVWQLRQQRLADPRRYLDLIAKQWDSALSRLGTFVED
jgi:predicted transcriptional regulator